MSMNRERPETRRRRWNLFIGCGAVAILLLAAFLLLNVIGLAI